MAYSVALAGKGGTGKTTMAGLLIKFLLKKNKTPILAVDADCNANLNEVLGLELGNTLGGAREDMKKGDVPSGMTKDIFMEKSFGKTSMENHSFQNKEDDALLEELSELKKQLSLMKEEMLDSEDESVVQKVKRLFMKKGIAKSWLDDILMSLM